MVIWSTDDVIVRIYYYYRSKVLNLTLFAFLGFLSFEALEIMWSKFLKCRLELYVSRSTVDVIICYLLASLK